jgi:hypothetical protein
LQRFLFFGMAIPRYRSTDMPTLAKPNAPIGDPGP